MDELYARLGSRLSRFALSLLGDRDAAQDVVQETFLAAWQGAGSYQGGSSVSTWLLGICRNKVRDQLRRRPAAIEPLEEARGLVSPGSGEETVEFWACFRQMDANDQELIQLVFHQGLSLQEVAEVLGIPVGTVKSRTFYARRRLRQLLRGGDSE